jgi:sphingosine kinase
MFSFEFYAKSRVNAINVVATLNDIAIGKPIQNAYNELSPKRKLLVFLNPFSNAGRAARVWRSAINILDKAYINRVFIETERAGHAYNFMSTEDLDEYDGVVSVSGDGLLHEIINGILNRKDKYYLKRKIPIGIIPGGSADGLSKSLMEKSEEKMGLEQSCLLIIKGQTRLMDITKLVLAGRPKPVYSFLSVTWGLVADIDLESERIR